MGITNKHIFLIGFMGTGKTTIAAELCKILPADYLDTDQMIIEKEGTAIEEIFERKGEVYFRQAESSIISDLKKVNTAVVSCGGGIVLKEENVINMKEVGIIFLLTALPETIYDRVKDDSNRPLLNANMNVKYIQEMMEKRGSHYMNAADYVVKTDHKEPEEIVEEISSILKSMKK